MNQPISIFWFRRDLRLDDNIGLFNALNSTNPVLPVFIFDTEILSKLPKDDARVKFIFLQLEKVNKRLKEIQSGLTVYHSTPINAFKDLISNHNIKEVYTNHDYEPYAIERDKQVESFLSDHGIKFNTFKDQVIFERNEIVKDDGNPYKVYTPYSKKWLERFNNEGVEFYPSEKLLNNTIKSERFPFKSFESLGFKGTYTPVPDFTINDTLINHYEATRNFPALESTSRIGPHLRFGTVSIRKVVVKASKYKNVTFLKELIWREFFMQILWHFPHTATNSFKPKYDRIEWRNNEEEYQKWCKGETGYPLVDAGMRQLNQTGFMHNRVRMVVGSFLCKHLLIDWRWGEAYFAEKLHDYEMASNIGNWQWVAGCGVDAAPYFRIFNPTTQIQKFDKNHEYIKNWVPNFQDLTYSSKIVEHKFARERCLETYRSAIN